MSYSACITPPSPTTKTHVAPAGGRDLLTSDEERDLSDRVALGDREARARLIRSNVRLVAKIARGFEGRGMALEDLIGEGNLGLIRATETYDARFGTRFGTYAGYWIKESIRRALLNTSATIRLPVHVVTLLSRWKAAERELKRELGEAPSADRVAAHLGLSPAKQAMVEKALRAGRLRPGGGTAPGGEARLDAEPADPRTGPASGLEAEDDRDDLRRRLLRLDPRERAVVTLRFGLGDGEPLTLTEVGARLGLTREWVRKVEARAIQKLR